MTKAREQTLPATVEGEAMTNKAIVLPLMSGQEMAQAIQSYRDLQHSLDKAMPDQLMELSGRIYRKKGYWRSIRTAFGLSCECIKEERLTEGQDWGYVVTYRATAPSGNFSDGDGATMATEKSRGRMMATEHNVRSHAHTRAMNRAISNLVGFGEVSAEEIEDDGSGKSPGQKPQPRPNRPPNTLSDAHNKLTEELYNWIKEHPDPESTPEASFAQILKILTSWEPYTKADGTEVKGFDGITKIEDASDKMAQVALGKFRKRLEEEAARVEASKKKGGKKK